MPSLPSIFSNLPDELRDALSNAFSSVRQNYTEQRWEPSELNGGKFSEAVYRVLEWHASSTNVFTPLGTQVKDFRTAVRAFENDTRLSDSVRFHIPNALTLLYTVRNKRGVGHLGGDVNPNRMDAEVVLGTTNWVMAELVRLFHSVNLKEAQQAVESLVEKRSALVWEVAEVKRILNSAISYTDRVLVFLHSSHPEPVAETELFTWCEHSNASAFRTQVLKKAHKERLLEYDAVRRLVYLSPTGVEAAEKILRTYESV